MQWKRERNKSFRAYRSYFKPKWLFWVLLDSEKKCKKSKQNGTMYFDALSWYGSDIPLKTLFLTNFPFYPTIFIMKHYCVKVELEKDIMNISKLWLGEILDFYSWMFIKCNFLLFFSCPWVCLSARLAMEKIGSNAAGVKIEKCG